jgi:hypothetical protein
MKQNVHLVVTSAFMLAGDMAVEGDIVEVTNAEARDLLDRGKARPATAEDGVADEPEADADGEPEADAEPEAPAKAKK